jgi:predicted RNA-binding Zn-ribbon protein involved in translation (DUF1610 family)
MREIKFGKRTLFACPVCGEDIDWHLFQTAEETQQYCEDLICPYCKYPDKYKRQTIIKRRRKK